MLRGNWSQSGLIALGVILSPISCIKSRGVNFASASDSLTIVGSVLDLSGSPVSDAVVFAERDDRVAAVTDSSGFFRFELTRTDLAQITSRLEGNRRSFQLYFQQGPKNLFSAGPGISVSEIGEKNLGPITLKNPGSFTAQVLRADNGQIIGPAAGAQVRFGPVQTFAKADGSLVIDRAPSGLVPLSVTVPGFQNYNNDIENMSNPGTVLQDPIIVFAGTGADGVVVDKTERSLAELIAIGHPTSKRFKIHSTPETRYIRFSHDLARLESLQGRESAGRTPSNNGLNSGANSGSAGGAGTAQAPSSTPPPVVAGAGTASDITWQPVTQVFDYDFPASGGQTLYYQFSDSSKSKFSRIYQLSVDVDVFADSRGIKIAGSANGSSPSSQIELEIDLPRAAVSMRISDDMRQLVSLPWAAPADKTVYNFIPLESETGQGGEAIRREIYAQFRDAFGRESKVFKTVAFMQMFKPFSARVVSAGGLVTSQVVSINIEQPPGSYYMRAAESQEGLIRAVWQPAQPRLDFTLSPRQDLVTLQWYVSGQRQVCVQLRDPNGFISEAQCPNFLVELFPLPEGGFIINGGSQIATSKVVELSIAVPPNATEMRIFENGPDTSSSADITIINLTGLGGTRPQINDRLWLKATPQAIFVFSTIGSRTLFLQFRGPGGIVSSVHSQSIVIIPMVDAYQQTRVLVNQGNPVTLKPVVRLDLINIPATAIEMQIFVSIDAERDRAPLDDPFIFGATNITGTWRPVAPFVDIALAAPGLNGVTVLFRNSDRQVSPAFKNLVTYNPFPPELITVVSNGGSAITFDRLINLAVQAPETAFGMRVRCDAAQTDFTTVPYGPFQPNRGCLLGPVFGLYAVQVQFRTIEFIESVTFTTYVRYVEPFPDGDVTTILNDGAAETTEATVRIGIGIPLIEAAKFIRIGEDSAALENMPFASVDGVPTYTIKDPVDGQNYKIYVQYKTAGGTISKVAFDDITYKKPN
jgi:hypothetical protein